MTAMEIDESFVNSPFFFIHNSSNMDPSEFVYVNRYSFYDREMMKLMNKYAELNMSYNFYNKNNRDCTRSDT